jgi:Rieske Fe-S protein
MANFPLAETDDRSAPSRRAVLRGATALGVAGLAGAGLAACGGGGSSGTSSGSAGSSSPSGSAASGSAAAGSGSSGGTALAKTSQIPVGGGKVFDAQKVVVTQPTAGQFKAFTAVCTHMQCLVSSVTSGIIKCPCHGSMYSATDGSVKGGPAPRPLAAEKITVSGGEITLG